MLDTGVKNASVRTAMIVAFGLVLLFAVFVGTAAADAPEAGNYTDILNATAGTGTTDDPYQITDVTELQAMAGDLEANYTLVRDIDANETSSWNGGNGFTPVGDGTKAFIGNFDGNDHTITGLYIDRVRPDNDGTGLFGNTGVEAIIENVGLEDANVSNANNRVGALVGNNTGMVNSAYATGNVSGSGKVGGLVGENKDGGTVNASHATATVSSDSDCIVLDECYVGGLVGDNGGTVDRSYATGNVSGDDWVGGLVGSNYDFLAEGNGTINRSYATGTVSGSNKTGGLIGQNSGIAKSSYATGPVSGDTEVGGLVGDNSAGGTVESSYATGNVFGDDSVGGLVGFNRGTAKSSYATGPVSGDTDVGGLVGFDDQGTVTDGYWDVNTTNQTGGIGEATQYTDNDSTGLTTGEMKGDPARENMSAFDFAATWDVVDENLSGERRVSYPFLVDNRQEPAPGLEEKSGERNCLKRRDVSRGEGAQECPTDRDLGRGESRGIGRNGDSARRNTGRRSRGR